jgi:FkbM family methyltransferase
LTQRLPPPIRRLGARLLSLLYRRLVPWVSRLEDFHGYSLLETPPAYAFVQADVVANLPEYRRTGAGEIRRIVIVGAWHGEEVDEMLVRFPRCHFLLLEPSKEAYSQLSRRLAGNPRVTCLQVAAADRDERTTFHEMSITGNGSLLSLAGPSESSFRVPEIEEIDSYEVQTVRLDSLPELSDDTPIDCMWIDVQGSELAVLEGAEGLLDRVGAAFVEVATDKLSYEGATSFVDLQALMSRHAFRLASLGTDPVNGQGNALWLAATPGRSRPSA